MPSGYVGPNGQWVTPADVPNKALDGSIAAHSAVLAADGIVYSGQCIFYGLQVVTAGTSVTVYDNTAASGTAVMTAVASTAAGAMLTPAGAGIGVRMDNGIYLDLTLGTYVAFYLPL